MRCNTTEAEVKICIFSNILETGNPCVSATKLKSEQQRVSTTLTIFLRSSNSTELVATLYDRTGRRTFKMAVSKPEICVSQLIYQIATRFLQLYLYFRDPIIQRNWLQCCTTKLEVNISRWRPVTVLVTSLAAAHKLTT